MRFKNFQILYPGSTKGGLNAQDTTQDAAARVSLLLRSGIKPVHVALFRKHGDKTYEVAQMFHRDGPQIMQALDGMICAWQRKLAQLERHFA